MINIGLITSKQAQLRPNAWAVYDETSKKELPSPNLINLLKKLVMDL